LFSVPYTTINIGMIKGGDAVNKVPDRCYIKFDARTVKENHNEVIEKKLKEMLKKYDAKMEIGVNIKVNINKNNEMIKQIEEITQCEQKSENYVTEASFISNSDTIILGLGPITAHQSNEYIEVDKLERLVNIYEKILETYCLR